MSQATCECGRPATTEVPRGHRRNGSAWHRVWAFCCDECARADHIERELQRGQ